MILGFSKNKRYRTLLVFVAASRDGAELEGKLPQLKKQLKNVACGILAVWAVTTASPVIAANQVQNIV